MRTISKKIILLGHFGVGKTSLVRRFVHSIFSDEYLTTVGVKIDKKVLEVGDVRLNMLIWDLAGRRDQGATPKNYLLGSAGAIYVTDLTRPNTYQGIILEVEKIQSLLPQIPVVTVANKKDLLTETELETALQNYPVSPDFLSSAKSGENVSRIFGSLAESLVNGINSI